MNLVQIQDHLKGVPTQALMAYANGQNPQVPPYVALGELNRRKQMEQAPAQPAQGSVKDQIEQSLMQPQALPGIAAQGVPVPQAPQPQGIPSQMPRQLASAGPQPTGMAGGGLTSVPLRKEMFNYAPGGIVAFDEGGDVINESLPEDLRVEGMDRGTRYRDEMEKARGKKDEPKSDKDERASDIAKALAFAGSPLAALADVAVSPINALRNIVRNPLDRSERPSMTPVSDARQRMLYGDTQEEAQPGQPAQPRMQGTQGSYTRSQMDAATDPRVRAMMASLAQPDTQEGGVASLRQEQGAPGAPGAGGAERVTGAGRVSGGASGIGGGGGRSGGPNDPIAALRAMMNASAPAMKTRAEYMAEAAKTNPELLSKPEEGLRGMLAQLQKSQMEGRQRAMDAEGRRGLADLSSALIAAGEATRGQRGSGVGSAFGGFGKSYNAATAAAGEREAARDALQQKQDMDMAKLQYEISEKARAHAEGNIEKEMAQDARIAEAQNRVEDNKRQAAGLLAQDERSRESNASAAALRTEQIKALREGKPSDADKVTASIMDKANRNPIVAGLGALVKSGSLVPGTQEFANAVRQVEAITAPYYIEMGRKPPPPAQIFEDAVKQKDPGFSLSEWISSFTSSKPKETPSSTIPKDWSVTKNP